ncbi:MAG: 50S ribosomal protein L24 [Flammeovirgaceae bacterium]|nr:50S ribosomal protein L24 [Flammeovirgaceae bacterium]MDW8287017.1 50S ribosomal protein L24 [Flammeovirgaceae bacterium]
MKKQKEVNHKFHVKKGDTVEVIAGNHKGKRGVILKVLRKKERAIVEGINMITKHIKPTPQQTQGGIVQQEGSIHISNLMVVDPKTNQRTRIGRRRDANGKLKRYSKKTNEFID